MDFWEPWRLLTVLTLKGFWVFSVPHIIAQASEISLVSLALHHLDAKETRWLIGQWVLIYYFF